MYMYLLNTLLIHNSVEKGRNIVDSPTSRLNLVSGSSVPGEELNSCRIPLLPDPNDSLTERSFISIDIDKITLDVILAQGIK